MQVKRSRSGKARRDKNETMLLLAVLWKRTVSVSCVCGVLSLLIFFLMELLDSLFEVFDFWKLHFVILILLQILCVQTVFSA